MQLLKLVANHIKVGAPLPFNVRDEFGHLLLAAGHVIASVRQQEALLSRGIHADVEEIKALAAGKTVAPQAPTLMARWTRAFWALDDLARDPPPGDAFGEACLALGQSLHAMVLQDPDVILYQMVRQEQHPLRMYGLTHAVFVAALCDLMATRLGWPDADRHAVLMAGLTMNLTILDLQARYAVYGRLNPEQRDELARHPTDTAARLRAGGVRDEGWLQAVEEHHEHTDGKGYPKGLTAVSEPAQLLRLADVVLAKVSRRESRPPLDVREAARQAYLEAPASPLVAALVRECGLYPPGDLVCLASGEQGVVIRRGPTPKTPTVATLTDRRGLPSPQVQRRDTGQSEYAIVSVNADKNLVARLPLERVYGLIY
ncbi:HD-GYP domain-containing protein [Inhella crocodyli]|uniref:Phosphohydrolase n=1 Tax=Inhella crocodyli TaxID=2499851 RepID=A0A3S2UH40_9BURK|nr:HD domain-containing phosphohydrolase [Inhella crocodyli]RVT87861.1 phosphohydrolase [Inhella crocodyli]